MKNKYLPILFLLSLNVSACSSDRALFKPSMFDDTLVTQRPILLQEDRFVHTIPTHTVSYDYLSGLVNDYNHYGSSPIYVVSGYDVSDTKQKQTALSTSAVIKGQLSKLGIKNATVQSLPLNGGGGETVIGYDRTTAKGPENCGKMPGYDTQTGAYGDYGLGCTVLDMMAKQIAYPNDLRGQSEMSSFDADRAAAPVNRDNRSGDLKPFVPSYVLSELAGQTAN